MTRLGPGASKLWFDHGYAARKDGKELYEYPQRIAENLPTPLELIDAWKDGWKAAELEIRHGEQHK